MTGEIKLVDSGRGLQLSTSRITVMDLAPYFQRGCSHAEIIRWIPSLTPGEIAVVEAHYHEHKTELDEKDRRVREHRAEQTRLQAIRFGRGSETREELRARLRRMLEARGREANGERHPR